MKLGLTGAVVTFGLSLGLMQGCYGSGGGHHHDSGGAGGTSAGGTSSGGSSTGGRAGSSTTGGSFSDGGSFTGGTGGASGGSTSSGGSAGTVASGGFGNVSGTPCEQTYAVAETCGLLSAGTRDCTGDHTSQCQANCLLASNCTEISDALCNAVYNTLATCILNCPEEQLPCGDGTSYPAGYECDGFDDCTNGVDEANCDFACGDGTTVPMSYKCDGFDDCANASDEAGCAVLNCSP